MKAAVDGPGLIDKIVHDPRPHTVRDRARYIYEQLQKPEAERVLRIPEIDAQTADVQALTPSRTVSRN